jgi:hypothetical protein
MKPQLTADPPPPHRHRGTRSRSAAGKSKPLSDEEVRREVRAWEVRVVLEELQAFGLRAPPGLQSVFDLYILGRLGQSEIQAYLDRQLSTPVAGVTMDVEVHHA